jgi:hypothetical protein
MRINKKFGHPAEDWDAAKAEAKRYLVAKARQHQTVTYSELSLAIQSITIPHYGYMMTGMLNDIHRDDLQFQRPGLATLVVRKSDGLPGPGYFKSERELGIPEGSYKEIWQARFDDVCDYWQNHDLDPSE